MAMLKDEITIIKALCVNVTDDVAMLVTLQYHTEQNNSGKVDHEKSKYRWYARIVKTPEFQAEIRKLMDDSVSMNKHFWPKDPDPWCICINNSNTNKNAARFYALKLRKAVSWEEGLERLKGFTPKTAKKPGGYNQNAVYETTGYKADNGDVVDLTDKEALLAHVGQSLYKVQAMKRAGTKSKEHIVA